MLINRKLSLITVVRLNVLQYCMHYHSGRSSCYETLAVPGMRFVDKKLSLTTIVRLNIFQHCCIIILACLVVMRYWHRLT